MFELGKSFIFEELSLSEGSKPFSMIWIPSGSFIMGKHDSFSGYISNHEDEYESENYFVPHEFNVQISKGFWLGQYPVTKAHWQAFQGNTTKIEDENVPIYGINWMSAMLFCKKLNMEYKSQLPKGYHFSLPTEAQWEYACKANSTKDYITIPEREFLGTHEKNIVEVGQKGANAWNLYDMLGNVREWCYDIPVDFEYCKEEIIPDNYYSQNGEFPDWNANTILELDSDINEEEGTERMLKGQHVSVYREFAPYGTSKYHGLYPAPPLGFRVTLRPISNLPKCDLDDPLLQKEGINMLE